MGKGNSPKVNVTRTNIICAAASHDKQRSMIQAGGNMRNGSSRIRALSLLVLLSSFPLSY